MKFINQGKDNIKVRTGKRFKSVWITVRKGETIDLPESKGKRYGFEKVSDSNQKLPKVTEGKIGDKKVETKQIESKKKDKEADFYNELIKIKGIAFKTAEDIIYWGIKEDLIEAIKLKEHLPFRNDVAKKLKRKYG